MHIHIQKNNTQSGFVALMSTIVIGAVMLIMTIEAGKNGFYTSHLVLGAEAKEQSRLLAFGCGDRTLAKMLSHATLEENITIASMEGFCTIKMAQKEYPNNGDVTIWIQATVRESVTNFELTYKTGNVHLGKSALPLGSTNEVLTEPYLSSTKELPVMP
jgi:hypothetical protein